MRLVLGFVFFMQIAFSAQFVYPDFKQCYNKNQNSFVYIGQIRAIAVGPHSAVAYSKTKPTVPFVKYDPFLNLYLFHTKQTLHPVRLKSTHALKVGEWIGGMDEDSLFVGNFAKSGDVLDSMYLQNTSLKPNSIISCLCCDVYGLGVGKGEFIGSEYIKRFINTKDIFYGDVGARFEKRDGKFYVADIDPFYKNNQLNIGDEILSINNKKVNSLKELNQAILFATPKSKIKLAVKRGNKTMSFSSMVVPRSGGGNIEDSFLEKKGLLFDAKMKIVKIQNDSFAQKSGLKIGDKLLEIDQMPISSSAHLRKILSDLKGKEVHLLFDRNDFQFFVNLTL